MHRLGQQGRLARPRPADQPRVLTSRRSQRAGPPGGERPDRLQLPVAALQHPGAGAQLPQRRPVRRLRPLAAGREHDQPPRIGGQMRPPPRGGRGGQPVQAGQRGHGDRRLAAAGRVLADHADQPLAGQHRRPRHARPLRLAQRLLPRRQRPRGTGHLQRQQPAHQVLARQDHSPHLRGLPHHPRGRLNLLEQRIPHRPAALHRHRHRRVPVHRRHRRGRQLSGLVAELEQRQIHRVRIPGQPVNDPRRMGHLVRAPHHDPRRGSPGHDMRGGQHQPPAQPESRPIPVPLSRPGSEGRLDLDHPLPQRHHRQRHHQPPAELSPCAAPTPAPP